MTRGRPRVIAQYLEGGPEVDRIDRGEAIARLASACRRLPITDLCLGWNLPDELAREVAAAGRGHGADVWLWHPVLAGDGRFVPDADRAIGATGRPVPAVSGMAEFLFDCPIRASARSGALDRLMAALDHGHLTDITWDGVLLDKIRWPSPFADPGRDLA